MRKLIYLVGISADGFIAASDGSADGFPLDPEVLGRIFTEYPETCPAHLREALAVTGEARHFDTVVMGYRTHEPALQAGLSSAYPHLRQYVVTHRGDLPPDPSLTVVHDHPVALVRDLKAQPGRDVWLCGGANLAGQLVDEIDEVHLKVYPVVFGSGVPLVSGSMAWTLLLVSSTPLGAGVLLNIYGRG
ncbi:dihydrofolate reductase family protein [Tessaracoccus antarcticus]|uniref:Dihydrofolate reductase n=1 Tax=Tessaracoccus antarcticus TaxID=2479848 RepID=A0A3M0GJW9_9ACTN|nr:dihydrofolate reductase family protein [Tessaracoccus antarcticus]RMB61923.1 dihydrofolate reductase [Tessaracoccus antarcticus]